MASFRATSAYRLYFAELGTDPTLNAQAAPDGSSSGLRDIPQGQEVEQGLEQGWPALGHVTLAPLPSDD